VPGDPLVGFDIEDEPLRSSLHPQVEIAERHQTVEGTIQLHDREVLSIVLDALVLTQSSRIEALVV
jgi:hypothetical protein